MTRHRTLPGTPYWTAAYQAGHCAHCGSKIEPGARVLFFPTYRTVLCGAQDCGEQAAQEFNTH